MRYDKVKKNASQLLSLTGFTVSEFESLLPTFQYEWEGYYSHFTLKGEVRQRISYSRKTSKLPMTADKLLFILSYLKNNPLQEYHGATFGMTQPQCNNWVHFSGIIEYKNKPKFPVLLNLYSFTPTRHCGLDSQSPSC